MDTLIFEKFRQKCSEKLPEVIDEILSLGKEEKVGAIGFITTDDFYGLPYPYSEKDGIDFISSMLSANEDETFAFAITGI